MPRIQEEQITKMFKNTRSRVEDKILEVSKNRRNLDNDKKARGTRVEGYQQILI